MDAKMLNTGSVPVGAQLDRLPAAGNTERMLDLSIYCIYHSLTTYIVKQPAQAQEEDDEEAELAKLRAEMAM
jgi:charged multivesicular body protein 4